MIYLARYTTPAGIRYILRESYLEEDIWGSRDLFDLGDDPGKFIVYPGGNSFYVSEEVEEAFQVAGSTGSDDDLENLLLPFVDPEIRYKIEPFLSRSAAFGKRKLTNYEERLIQEEIHLFDKRRLYYLRYGNIDQSNIFGLPSKLFRVLLNKSRDELEQFFQQEELVLEADQVKEYFYVVFDLPRHFESLLARTMPAGLDPEKMDEVFLADLCRLNDDRRFWAGFPRDKALPLYLARYVWLYFGAQFDETRARQEFIRQFTDSHRTFRWPEKKEQVSSERLVELFGVDAVALKKMSKRELTKLFRQKAHEHHPDKGGEHDYFVELAAAYNELLKGKE